MATDIKKSNFTAQTAVLDTDYFDFVRTSTNYKVTFADLKSSVGITVDLASVGNPLGNPTMYASTATSYKFRSIESGSGVIAQISPLNGIEIGLNLTQEPTGAALFDDLAAAKPTIASFVAGSGITIVKDTNKITVSYSGGSGTTVNTVTSNANSRRYGNG